jgi:putative transposase
MVQLPKTIRLPHEAYANPDRVFHVTMRAAIGERPFTSRPTGAAIWQLVVNERERDSIELLAACLMPDHLHALVSPRSKDIIRWVDGFKSWSTRVAPRTRPQRILWQPGFYDRAVRSGELDTTVKYILENPVAAGLVDEAERWPWVAAWVSE